MPKSVLMLQLMDLLRERPGLTISQLAVELGRSGRTIYRYLESLSAKLHMQVYRQDGGYYLAEHILPSQLDLTSKEILAVRLALTSGAFSRSGPLADYARSAWRKIESALTSDTVETVQDSVMKREIYTPSFSESEIGFKTVQCIANALGQNRRLSVVYSSHRSGETKTLEIDPYALIFRRHNWYLIAYSYLHERTIQLKLARIIKASETSEVFKLPDEFSIESFYAKNWEMWTGREEQLVKVKFSPEVAHIIRESKRHPTQVLEDTPDGSVVFSVRVAGIEEIGCWILSWGANAEVLEPAELRSSIEEIAAQLLAIYSGTAASESRDGEVTEGPLPEVKIKRKSRISCPGKSNES